MASRGLAFALALALTTLAVLPPASAHAANDARTLWERYRAEFISADGRVIDRARAHVTTSESQAYAMLLAYGHDDRATFDLVWRWTRANLGVRPDGLLAWLWGKRPTGQWEVIEYNNATDADVLAAYALLLASERWGAGEYRSDALKLVRAMRQKLAVWIDGEVYLLPGYHGFAENGGVVTLNPSYMVFPAYRAFVPYDAALFWDRAITSAFRFMAEMDAAPHGLLPDWAGLDPSGGLTLDTGRRPLYGYEAVRVYMHFAWDGVTEMPAGFHKLLDSYGPGGPFPASIDLETGAALPGEALAGAYAIYARAARAEGRTREADALDRKAAGLLERELASGTAYYSFSLYLLARFGE